MEKKVPNRLLQGMFYLSLFNAGLMNVLSIYHHRPRDGSLPEAMSLFFAVVMGFTTSFLLAGLSLPVTDSTPLKVKRAKVASTQTLSTKAMPVATGRKRGRPRKNAIPVLNP